MKIATGDNESIGGNEFELSVNTIIKERRFKKIIETGTLVGLGSTKIILDALKLYSPDYEMFSIEVNPEHYKRACENLKYYKVNLINGLSVPQNMLLSEEETEELISSLKEKDIFVDHKEKERLKLYIKETAFDVPDDCLNKCMSTFGFKPDLLMLDSAGHMGWTEFNYALELLEGPCVFILDDVFHIKHYKSLQLIQNSDQFKIIKLSTEKFGFVIAEYL